MKKALFILIFCTFYSCNCKKNTVLQGVENKQFSIESECPENGKCTIELLKNKAINFKSDEFGTGYYTLEESATTSVIQYQYNRTVPEGLQDGNHKEEVLFEITYDDNEVSLTDSELQNTKMIFGRICFCRGQTGYYQITNGTLHLKKDAATISVDLDFKITQVPQLYSKIKATIN